LGSSAPCSAANIDRNDDDVDVDDAAPLTGTPQPRHRICTHSGRRVRARPIDRGRTDERTYLVVGQVALDDVGDLRGGEGAQPLRVLLKDHVAVREELQPLAPRRQPQPRDGRVERRRRRRRSRRRCRRLRDGGVDRRREQAAEQRHHAAQRLDLHRGHLIGRQLVPQEVREGGPGVVEAVAGGHRVRPFALQQLRHVGAVERGLREALVVQLAVLHAEETECALSEGEEGKRSGGAEGAYGEDGAAQQLVDVRQRADARLRPQLCTATHSNTQSEQEEEGEGENGEVGEARQRENGPLWASSTKWKATTVG
jgi:hypothetical protein